MQYYFSKFVDMTFDEAVTHVTKALAAKGFGVLTTIDVHEEQARCRFQAVHNPRGLQPALCVASPPGRRQDRHLMLPCNVIVSETMPGKVEVAAVDPIASMASIENPALAGVASEVRRLLQEVISGL